MSFELGPLAEFCYIFQQIHNFLSIPNFGGIFVTKHALVFSLAMKTMRFF